MSVPPRLPSRTRKSDADSYTWMGVIWLLAAAGGFLMLCMAILPLLNVLGAMIGIILLNVLGYVTMGRWVARRIAADEAAKRALGEDDETDSV